MISNILIAEDDKDITEILRMYLENAGYKVTSVADGFSAYDEVMTGRYDLAVVDIMMPLMDGFELIRLIRTSSSIPVIVLSAMDSDNDKIRGLDIGADDYITKPFNPLELVARVRSNLRRAAVAETGETESDDAVTAGSLTLYPKTLSLLKEGVPVELTPKEFRILSAMMKNPGRVFTRKQLYECAAGTGIFMNEYDGHTVIVHISNLRDKIEEDPRNPVHLKTVRGIGYKFEK